LQKGWCRMVVNAKWVLVCAFSAFVCCMAATANPVLGHPIKTTVCELWSRPNAFLEKVVEVNGIINGNGIDMTVIEDVKCSNLGIELIGSGAAATTPNAEKIGATLSLNRWLDREDRSHLTGTVVGKFGLRDGHLGRHYCIDVIDTPELVVIGPAPRTRH